MKKFILCLLVIALFTANQILYSQNGYPPDPGGSPVENETPVGGGAPVGNGIVLLFISAIGYGVLKLKQKSKLLS